MGKETLPCPNWVFDFPVSVPLVIYGSTFEYFKIYHETHLETSRVDFEAINLFLFSGVSHGKLMELMQESDLDNIIIALTETHPIITVPTILVVIIIILLLFVLAYRKTCPRLLTCIYRQPINPKDNGSVENPIEMKTLEPAQIYDEPDIVVHKDYDPSERFIRRLFSYRHRSADRNSKRNIISHQA